MKKYIKHILSGIGMFFVIPSIALAQYGLDEAAPDSIERELPDMIGAIISGALAITSTVLLLLIIYGGFLWLPAGGDSAKIQKGRQILTWSVIGAVVILGGYAITSFIIGQLA